MKQGATYNIVVNLKDITDLAKVDKIIFTFEGKDHKQVQKVYPGVVKHENNQFLVPLHQEDTLTLKGLTRIEAQINFKDKNVAKSEITNVFLKDTLATETVAGNTPNTASVEDVDLSIAGTIAIGIDGATFTPHAEKIAENIITISWTNESGLDNPETVTLTAPKGEKGDRGDKGDKGEKGDKGDLPIASTSTLGGVKIGQGLSVTEDGTISPTVETWTFTLSDNTTVDKNVAVKS